MLGYGWKLADYLTPKQIYTLPERTSLWRHWGWRNIFLAAFATEYENHIKFTEVTPANVPALAKILAKGHFTSIDLSDASIAALSDADKNQIKNALKQNFDLHSITFYEVNAHVQRVAARNKAMKGLTHIGPVNPYRLLSRIALIGGIALCFALHTEIPFALAMMLIRPLIHYAENSKLKSFKRAAEWEQKYGLTPQEADAKRIGKDAGKGWGPWAKTFLPLRNTHTTSNAPGAYRLGLVEEYAEEAARRAAPPAGP